MHLMPDGPCLQLDVDEITLSPGMFRSWLVCAGLHSLNWRLRYKKKKKKANHPQSPQSYCAALTRTTWSSIKKRTSRRRECRGPLSSPSPLVVFEMLEICSHHPLRTSAPVSLCWPAGVRSKRHFQFTAFRSKKKKKIQIKIVHLWWISSSVVPVWMLTSVNNLLVCACVLRFDFRTEEKKTVGFFFLFFFLL